MTTKVTLLDVLRASVRNAPRLPGQLRVLPEVVRARGTARVSIGRFVERNARRWARRPALMLGDRRVSWRELNRLSNRLAHTLKDRGLNHGDVVALLVPTSVELIALVTALAKLGVTAALLNGQQRGRVLAHSVEVSGACAVIAHADLVAALESPEAEVWPLADLLSAAADNHRYDPSTTAQVTLDDPAFTIFTSGTTGLPKASVMTHKRWVKASAVYGHAFLQLHADDVLYVPLPFFHNLALTACWAASCRTGAAMALAPKFSATRFWDDVRRYGATAFPYIGEIPRYLLAQPPSPHDKEHNVTRCFGVGMRAELWEPFQERFGIEGVFEHYAASEANTMFINPLNIPGSIGFCITPHELVRYDADAGELVRGPDGKPVIAGKGEPGLLISEVTERFSYDGYTDPEASEKKLLRDVFEPGDVWFDSGDLLRKVGWGHAVFVDRVGDTFRWKSENVSTGEVETILGGHPCVEDCTVYGVLVPGASGRAGMAAVVPGEGFDADAVLRYLREELPGYAVPVFLRLRGALETTGTFKHRKGDLRSDGFDPTRVDDPLFVALPRQDGWTEMTEELHARIAAEDQRL